MIHSPSQQMLVKPTLSPKSRTAAANGKGVDCRGYTRALVVCRLGTHDRTTGDETINFKVEESADNNSFAAVTSAETGAIGDVVPDTDSGNVYTVEIDLTKRLRYLRVATAVAGTTPIDLCGADILLFNPKDMAVAQDATVVRV